MEHKGKHSSSGARQTRNVATCTWHLPWRGISGVWGRNSAGACTGWGAERAHMAYVILSPCSVVLPREKVSEGNFDSEEVESKWLKGGVPRISVRGYIIISKVNICFLILERKVCLVDLPCVCR